MKLKYAVTDLIAEVTKAKEAAIAERDAKIAAHPAREKVYRAEVAKALRKELEAIEKGGKLPSAVSHYQFKGVEIPVKGERPSAPAPLDLRRFDKRILELRRTSQTEIVVDRYSAEWRGLL